MVITAAIFIPLLLTQTSNEDLEQLAQMSPNQATTSDDRIEKVGKDSYDLLFTDTSVFDALHMVGTETGRNIVLQAGASGVVHLSLRNVSFKDAFNAILRANQLDFEVQDDIYYVYPKRAAEDEDPFGQIETEVRVFKLNYVTALAAEDFIKPLLDETCVVTRTGELQVGIESDKESAGGFSAAGREIIVVLAPIDKMELIATVLREFDQRPPQVLVEATIMRATLNDRNALGIDFNTLLGVNLELMNANSPGLTDLNVGQLPAERLDDFSATIRTDFNAQLPGGGFTIGIVKDHVAGFIRALEETTDVTVMANPKMLTLNKQRGEVIVGRRDGYLTTTITETTAVQTVEYLETGTKLIFRPFVTGNGEVRMEIHPEDSNGGLTAANLPFQETTEATSNILIKDGNSILIGGLFRERSTVGKTQVPGVGNIPFIGHAFGIQQDQTIREEVIILLTVHVLDDHPEDAEFAAQAIDDIERIRVGARDGLMGTGRVQFAEARYQRAVELVQQGELDKALHEVRMSLHMNPRHLDAIKLRERIENERNVRSSGSMMRSFLQELLNAEDGETRRPVFGYPNLDELMQQAEARQTQDAMSLPTRTPPHRQRAGEFDNAPPVRRVRPASDAVPVPAPKKNKPIMGEMELVNDPQ